MPQYTFQVCDAEGSATSSETRELDVDILAVPVAADLLNGHVSAQYVAVWDGDRFVLSRHRVEPVFRWLNEKDKGHGASR
jgi:hypothetical protein